MSPAEAERAAKLAEVERLRAAEKFIVKSTGEYECTQCSFVYAANQPRPFDDLPSTWKCPVCRSPKDTFEARTVTIAGFEENQSYGLGTNQMTGGQKNLLIFGSLAAFFLLFIAGYALE
ncbi:unnamed protein product [Phaeothamnion confervicola]